MLKVSTLFTSLMVVYCGTAGRNSDVHFTWTSCAPEDFDRGSCTLSCTVSVTDTEKYNFSYAQWEYYSTNENNSIILYDGTQLALKGSTYTLNLTLDDYNAGTYKCFFVLSNNDHWMATFKIGHAITGANLNEECTDSCDCYALHATCSGSLIGRGVCQCSGTYNIQHSGGEDTLACLKLQPIFGHCYSEMECDWPTQSSQCTYDECWCSYDAHYIDMIVDGKLKDMCIKPADFLESCDYDEQCQLLHPETVCYKTYISGKTCRCKRGFTLITPTDGSPMYCEPKTLSGGAIAAIIMACLMGVILVSGVIVITVFTNLIPETNSDCQLSDVTHHTMKTL